jgi:cytochrome c5
MLEHPSEEEKTQVEIAGEKSFDRVCSQCHTLPNPMVHAASDWPRIVDRMRENMVRMLKPLPDDATTQEIVAYLSANAR